MGNNIKKQVDDLERRAGLVNTTPFAKWVKDKNPDWRGTDYEAYKLWLQDQLNRDSAENEGM